MKRYSLILTAAVASAVLLAGCGKQEEPPVQTLDISQNNAVVEEASEAPSEEVVEEEEENHEGMVRSELTNEWIDEELENQRPIAVMVDNEKTALPHYGLNNADVVYEMMNSTMNGRITRLMVLQKDWKNIEQLGSVRSTRPTNVMLAGEWNAILIHDGGPFYIDDYLAKDWSNNLSGGFARFSNGKSIEFTEYVTSEDYHNSTTGKNFDGLNKRIEAAKYDTEYNENFQGNHFVFYDEDTSISEKDGAMKAEVIKLPFSHNGSTLTYNESTGLYEYSEYGMDHVDPLDDNKVLAFKNVILQDCTFAQLDKNGYLVYNVLDQDEDGYYLTNGYAIPIKWSKLAQNGLTMFVDAKTGEKLMMNTGKTYIGIIPSDSWDDMEIK